MIRVAIGLATLVLLLDNSELGRVCASDLPPLLQPIPVASASASGQWRQGTRFATAADILHESSFPGSVTTTSLRITGQATTANGTRLAGSVNAQQRFAQAPRHGPTNEQAVSLVVGALRGQTQVVGRGSLISGPNGTTSWLGMSGESTNGRSTFGIRADMLALAGESPAYSVGGYFGIHY